MLKTSLDSVCSHCTLICNVCMSLTQTSLLQNKTELTRQWQGPSLQSPLGHRSAACRWRLWTGSERTAWWTSVCSPETGSRTYEATPVRRQFCLVRLGKRCLTLVTVVLCVRRMAHIQYAWQLQLGGGGCYAYPGTSCCLMTGESIWGVKRKEKVEIETRWLPLTLRHSCSLIPAPSPHREPRWGEERKNWETLRAVIKLYITAVVHKIHAKLCMCALQMTVKHDPTHAEFSLFVSCLLTVKSSVQSHVARQTGRWLLEGKKKKLLSSLKFCPLRSLDSRAHKTTPQGPSHTAGSWDSYFFFTHVRDEHGPGAITA